MKVVIIIPARGGSKGLKNKNLLPLCGKPVMAHVIDAAKKAETVDRVVVSTDSVEIAKISMENGAEVIDRPKEYASDTSPIEDALRHAVRYMQEHDAYDPEVVVWLQANIPVRKSGQIDKVVNRLIESGADSAVTICRVSQYPQWMKNMDENGFLSPLMPGAAVYRRQDIEPMFLLDGAVLAIRKQVLMETEGLKGVHVYLGRRIVGIEQEYEYSIELDEEKDLGIADFYLKQQINAGC